MKNYSLKVCIFYHVLAKSGAETSHTDAVLELATFTGLLKKRQIWFNFCFHKTKLPSSMSLPPKFKASTVLGFFLAEGPYCEGEGSISI